MIFKPIAKILFSPQPVIWKALICIVTRIKRNWRQLVQVLFLHDITVQVTINCWSLFHEIKSNMQHEYLPGNGITRNLSRHFYTIYLLIRRTLWIWITTFRDRVARGTFSWVKKVFNNPPLACSGAKPDYGKVCCFSTLCILLEVMATFSLFVRWHFPRLLWETNSLMKMSVVNN